MWRIVSFFVIGLACAAALAQTTGDHEEFEYNRRLIKDTQSSSPKMDLCQTRVQRSRLPMR